MRSFDRKTAAEHLQVYLLTTCFLFQMCRKVNKIINTAGTIDTILSVWVPPVSSAEAQVAASAVPDAAVLISSAV